MVWQEDGQYPDLIIELLSDSTAKVDRTLKKALYCDRFHTQEYFWFSPDTIEFMGFRLVGGEYIEIAPTVEGWRWSGVLGLFLGVIENQLRFLNAEGGVVATPAEAARLAEQERDAAQQRAEALVQRLRDLGIEPENL